MPLAQARGHSQHRRAREDHAIVHALEELTRGEREPDAERGTRHPDEAQGAPTRGTRVEALDHGGLRGARGRAEDIRRHDEAHQRPRGGCQGRQEEQAARDEGRPHQVGQRRAAAERARPREREE